MIVRYIRFYNHERIQLKTGDASACATSFRLKLHIFLLRRLFVLSAQFGAVHITWGVFGTSKLPVLKPGLSSSKAATC